MDTILLSEEIVKHLIQKGVKNWFEIGLRFSEKNTWVAENWILDVLNKEKFFLAKIKYDF